MAEVPDLAPLDEYDPRQLGPYSLLGRLGEGGMGSVYLARRGGEESEPVTSTASQQLVAVKVIRSDLARIPEFRERFLREARAAQRVARFCTAGVLDVDTSGTRPYIVTEYIDGPTLAKAVRDRGPLPAADIEWLAIAVASALNAIHAAGVVHRDLKPSNILLSRYGARVIDFGIARALDATTMLTQGAIGTPAYMAPEQALGTPVTEAADIHAWGAVIVFASTARAPFDGDSLPRILRRVADDPPDLAAVPDTLRSLVSRAMAKDPADRPSAEELLLALHRVHSGPIVLPPPASDADDVTTVLAPTAVTGPLAVPSGGAPGDAEPAVPAGTPVSETPAAPAGRVRSVDPRRARAEPGGRAPAGPVPPPGPLSGGHTPGRVPDGPRRRRRVGLYVALAAIVVVLAAGVPTLALVLGSHGAGGGPPVENLDGESSPTVATSGGTTPSGAVGPTSTPTTGRSATTHPRGVTTSVPSTEPSATVTWTSGTPSTTPTSTTEPTWSATPTDQPTGSAAVRSTLP